ncbi:MAG: substrate-binding domain-containing protein, partial [Oscillospiraceae bacterium]|nr:substrate-binding domain-containing protein [Oscillospiraceae bacterium]
MNATLKRILGFSLCAALSAGMFAGCGSSNSTGSASSGSTATEVPAITAEASAETEAPVTLSGTVSTNGSTSMESVIGVLREQFMADNSGVTVTYDPTGSGTGIESVSNGSCDIGLSSRALKESETGLIGTTVALDGIAVIVNANNSVEDLTVEQIAAIFTGEITNWSE